jgi:phosphoribosylformylglycinamidine (FGAM) synthase-like amidotransferase family enzyme
MMNEEFERRWDRQVEFILNQQAQFEAGMVELRAAQARTEETANRAHETVMQLAALVHEGFSVVHNLIKETHAQIRESHRLTEEKIRNLTDLVDRNIRERRKDENGTQN